MIKQQKEIINLLKTITCGQTINLIPVPDTQPSSSSGATRSQQDARSVDTESCIIEYLLEPTFNEEFMTSSLAMPQPSFQQVMPQSSFQQPMSQASSQQAMPQPSLQQAMLQPSLQQAVPYLQQSMQQPSQQLTFPAPHQQQAITPVPQESSSSRLQPLQLTSYVCISGSTKIFLNETIKSFL